MKPSFLEFSSFMFQIMYVQRLRISMKVHIILEKPFLFREKLQLSKIFLNRPSDSDS